MGRHLASFALAAGVGLCAFFAALQFGEPTKQKLILVAALPIITLACVIVGRTRTVLLFLWVLLLPYNRMYYVFDGVVGNHGIHGPYLIPADLVLLALFGLWAHEAVILKRKSRPAGPRLERWLLPFTLACVLSAFSASQMSWALFDILRLVKFAAILVYVRYNFTRRDVWACIAALLCSLLVQSGIAILQMVLRSTSGLLGLLSGGAEDVELQQIGAAAVGGWLRAVGTVGHPSNLACYLLMPLPVAVALAVTAPRYAVRFVCAVASLVGLVGLTCTLSRWPAALGMLQLLTLATVLTGLGYLRATQTIGLVCVSMLVGASVVMWRSDLIHQRLTQDLGASLEFRAKDARVAWDLFEQAPLVGVGLNNYSVHMIERDPEFRWTIEHADRARHTLKIRTFVALHNFYLFMLAETGLLGLTTLLVLYLAVIYRGAQGVFAVRGVWQTTGVGLTVGMLGVLGQGLVDFSFWVDPILYTFALVAAMTVRIPTLAGAEAEPASRARGSARVPRGDV
ncbi:MAG: hypothetical protein GY842_01525 [bacterium]|nr:hypothetical protein [bacterium]